MGCTDTRDRKYVLPKDGAIAKYEMRSLRCANVSTVRMWLAFLIATSQHCSKPPITVKYPGLAGMVSDK